MLKRHPLLLMLSLAAGAAFAGERKISKDLENIDSDVGVDVIVQYKHAPTDAHHKTVTERGGFLKHKLDLVNGAAYRLTASALADLAKEPEVVYISPDRPLSAMLDYAEPSLVPPESFATIPWNASDKERTGYALDSGDHYALLFGTRQFCGLGDVGVGCWASRHSLLHETEKQLAPTLGFPPVKAKRELIEVVRQMLV